MAGDYENEIMSPPESEKPKKTSMDDVHAYWLNFPEAPASDSLKWIDTQGFEHLSTVRAWSPEFLFKAMGRLQVLIINGGGEPINSKAKPAPTTVQERDDSGIPVVDGEGQPVLIPLPANTHLFTVKGFYRGQNKDKTKDFLKVVVEEKPYNGKFGHNVFHPPFSEWKNWPLAAGETPGLFQPPVPNCGHVVMKDPEGDGKYPEIVEFRE